MLNIVYTSFQLLFDIIILAIPLSYILNMKLRTSKKVGLFIVYVLSFANVAVTVVRLLESIDNMHADQMSDFSPYQAFIARVYYTLWTNLELATAAIVANLPAMYVLWRRFAQRRTRPPTGTPPYFVFTSIANQIRRVVTVRTVERPGLGEEGPSGARLAGISGSAGHLSETGAKAWDRYGRASEGSRSPRAGSTIDGENEKEKDELNCQRHIGAGEGAYDRPGDMA